MQTLLFWEGDLCEQGEAWRAKQTLPQLWGEVKSLGSWWYPKIQLPEAEDSPAHETFSDRNCLRGLGVCWFWRWSYRATSHWESFEVSEQVFWGCFCLFALSRTTRRSSQNVLEGRIVCIIFSWGNCTLWCLWSSHPMNLEVQLLCLKFPFFGGVGYPVSNLQNPKLSEFLTACPV